MSSFLLVHGAFHGAWCWRDVVPLLRERGHQVTAIDLPGHGADVTPAEEVSLRAYAEAIVKAADGTILVGHSMAGLPISAAVELAPERFQALVYVAAHVPQSGMSVADMRNAAPRYPFGAMVSGDGGILSSIIDFDRAAEFLLTGCSPETMEFARARVRPEPIPPLRERVHLTDAYASVARHYVRCAHDRVIVPDYQRAMTAGWPAESVLELNCGHSPYFSCPGSLVDALLKLTGH